MKNASEGTSTNLKSGFFQSLSLKEAWVKEFKKSKFTLRGKARIDYFPTQTAATVFRPELGLKYRYRFNKKTELYFLEKNS